MSSDAGAGGFNANNGGNDEAGNCTQKLASSGSEFKRPSRRIKSVLPLTIRTVLELDENNQQYRGTQVNIVNIVGLIKMVNITSTKVIYTVNDTTGSIDVVKWLFPDMEEEEEEPLRENTYCRVHGRFKTRLNMKQVIALHLEPITNLNWITTHILEVIHTGLKMDRMKTEASDSGGMAGSSEAMSNSMVGYGSLGGSGMPGGDMGLTPQQKMVFEMIPPASEHSEGAGYPREQIKAKLEGKVTPQEVDTVLLFLNCEGHIYSTVDDDHFKTCEG